MLLPLLVFAFVFGCAALFGGTTLVAVGVGFFGLLTLWLVGRYRLHVGWGRASRMLGLSYIHRSDRRLARAALAGQLEDFQVAVTLEPNPRNLWSAIQTRFCVDSMGTIPSDVGFSAESTLLNALLGDEKDTRITVGDSRFDSLVRVDGDPISALALLDEGARAGVTSVVTMGADIADGTITATHKTILTNPEKLVERIQKLVEVAKRLRLKREDIPKRLAANASTDGNADVRRANLDCLLEHFGSAQETKAFAKGALESNDPEVRLRAAMLLGTDGFRAVCSAIQNSEATMLTRLEALRFLIRGFDRRKVIPVLEKLVAASTNEMRAQTIRSLTDLNHRPTLDLALKRLADASPAVLTASIAAVARFGSASDEPRIARLLSHVNKAVRLEAVKALSRVGTIASVEALTDARVKAAANEELKRAIDAAISRIQGRVGDADAGRLSIVHDTETAGGLAIAPPTGAVSVCQEKDED